jgi:hypothetical protein
LFVACGVSCPPEDGRRESYVFPFASDYRPESSLPDETDRLLFLAVVMVLHELVKIACFMGIYIQAIFDPFLILSSVVLIVFAIHDCKCKYALFFVDAIDFIEQFAQISNEMEYAATDNMIERILLVWPWENQ